MPVNKINSKDIKVFSKMFGYKFPTNNVEYFDNLVELYDAEDNLSIFLSDIYKLENGKYIDGELGKIRNTIVEDLKGSEFYSSIFTCKPEEIQLDLSDNIDGVNLSYKDFLKEKINLSKSSIYSKNNIGKQMISIDLTKANFQTTNIVEPRLLNADSWGDFMERYTDLGTAIASKYFRQTIFGNLNPKRLKSIEKYCIYSVFLYLKSKEVFTNEDVVALSDDELVVLVSDKSLNLLSMAKDVQEMLGITIHLQAFKLNIIEDTEFYVKEENITGKVTPMCVTNTMKPQVLRHLKGEEPRLMDRVFEFEGEIAYYKEPLFK